MFMMIVRTFTHFELFLAGFVDILLLRIYRPPSLSCKDKLVINLGLVNSGGSSISHKGGVHPLGGRGPLTWALFGENVCENKRIGSNRGACAGHAPPDPPMVKQYMKGTSYQISMISSGHVKT